MVRHLPLGWGFSTSQDFNGDIALIACFASSWQEDPQVDTPPIRDSMANGNGGVIGRGKPGNRGEQPLGRAMIVSDGS